MCCGGNNRSHFTAAFRARHPVRKEHWHPVLLIRIVFPDEGKICELGHTSRPKASVECGRIRGQSVATNQSGAAITRGGMTDVWHGSREIAPC
jgi:hypothetical protein